MIRIHASAPSFPYRFQGDVSQPLGIEGCDHWPVSTDSVPIGRGCWILSARCGVNGSCRWRVCSLATPGSREPAGRCASESQVPFALGSQPFGERVLFLGRALPAEAGPARIEGLKRVCHALSDLEVDAPVSVGGDGTMCSANLLYAHQQRFRSDLRRVRVMLGTETIDNDWQWPSSRAPTPAFYLRAPVRGSGGQRREHEQRMGSALRCRAIIDGPSPARATASHQLCARAEIVRGHPTFDARLAYHPIFGG